MIVPLNTLNHTNEKQDEADEEDQCPMPTAGDAEDAEKPRENDRGKASNASDEAAEREKEPHANPPSKKTTSTQRWQRPRGCRRKVTLKVVKWSGTRAEPSEKANQGPSDPYANRTTRVGTEAAASEEGNTVGSTTSTRSKPTVTGSGTSAEPSRPCGGRRRSASRSR